jgi:hypothetical protein
MKIQYQFEASLDSLNFHSIAHAIGNAVISIALLVMLTKSLLLQIMHAYTALLQLLLLILLRTLPLRESLTMILHIHTTCNNNHTDRSFQCSVRPMRAS